MASPSWETSRNRWRIRAVKDGKTMNFYSSRPGTAGRREVLRKYNDWIAQGEPKEATVLEVWDEFISAYIDRKGQCEQFKKIQKLSVYILPKIGKMKINSLRLNDWQKLISNAVPISGKETLSKKSLSNIRGVINQLVAFAVANDYMQPLKGSLYIPEGKPTKGKDILQPNEIEKLFEDSDLNLSQWYIYYFRFLLLTGLRPSEALGLKWSDIDTTTKVVTIRRAVNYTNNITEGKNKNARRQFCLTELTESILIKQKERTSSLASEFIFCNRIGGLGCQEQAAKEYKRITSTFASQTTPYCLRHTFVTLMSSSLPESILKKLVGHSASMDTFGTYGYHQLDGELKEASAKIDDTIKRIVG